MRWVAIGLFVLIVIVYILGVVKLGKECDEAKIKALEDEKKNETNN